MTWRDNYRPASFRGAPFFVEGTESSYGRRQAVHEHAQRDTPYTEDLGRKAREFSITGYVLGANYHLARDAVVDACEQAGPGQLVHPYKGELTVVCRGLSVSENSQEGGFCRLTLTFLEAGEASFPRAMTDSINAISGAGNQAITAAQGGFVSRFLTDGFPGFVRDAAAARLTAITDYLSSPGQSLAGEIGAAADYFYSVRDLAADAYDLVLQPQTLAQRLIGVLGSARGAFGSNSFAMLTGMTSNFDEAYTGSTATPSRKQQAANFEAMGELVRQVSVAESAKAAVVTEYPSYQDAIAARDVLLEQIDEEVEYTVNDDAFVALGKLRTEIARGIPPQDQRLPQLVEYTPPSTLPSLVVAHNLYNDAGRADEITARNKARHPGFLIGGTALEVLSDG